MQHANIFFLRERMDHKMFRCKDLSLILLVWRYADYA